MGSAPIWIRAYILYNAYLCMYIIYTCTDIGFLSTLINETQFCYAEGLASCKLGIGCSGSS